MAKKTTKARAATSQPAIDEATYARAALGLHSAPRHVPPPFSQAAAVRALSSWMYAAASINAQAVASVPLRLYVRAPGGGTKHLWRTRPVDRRRKAHVLGDGKRQPSRSVMAKAADFGSDFAEVTESHPVLDLLRKVNPWMNGFDLTTWRMLAMQQTGNAYIWVPQGNPPDQYWPMPPQWTRIVPDERQWVRSYVFGRDPSSEREFPPEEVVHFRMPSLTSMHYGTGYAEMAWSAISLLRENHEYDYSMARNHARPDYLLTVQSPGTRAEDLDRFEAKVEEKMRGKGKAGQFLALTGQVDLKPLNFMPKDMAGREDIVEEIAAIYRVPVTMLKANDPNLASATSGYAQWRESAVLPLCRLDEETLNQRLLPMFGLGDDAVLAYDDPVPENEMQEWDIAGKRFAVGAATPNEIRIADGDDPLDMPHMDEPFVGGKPVSQMDAIAVQPASQQTSPAATRATPADTAADPNAAVADTALNGAQVQALVELAMQSSSGAIPLATAQAIAASAFPLMTPQQVSAIFGPVASAPRPEPPAAPEAAKSCSCLGAKARKPAFVRQSDEIAKAAPPTGAGKDDEAMLRFLASMERIFGDQSGEVLAIISANAATPERILPAVQQAASAAKWPTQISEAIRPVVEDALKVGADIAARGLAASNAVPEPVFEFANPEVQRYVDTATTRLAASVNQTTVVRMSDLLADGLSNGETIAELRTRIEEMGVDPARAEMIARTESARAQMQGQEEAWKQSGVVIGKKWLLSPDACEFCRATAARFGETPVPLGTPFYAQGETAIGDQGGRMLLDYSQVDGPPLHPHCGCDLIPVL